MQRLPHWQDHVTFLRSPDRVAFALALLCFTWRSTVFGADEGESDIICYGHGSRFQGQPVPARSLRRGRLSIGTLPQEFNMEKVDLLDDMAILATLERLRDAVERVFPQIEQANPDAKRACGYRFNHGSRCLRSRQCCHLNCG